MYDYYSNCRKFDQIFSSQKSKQMGTSGKTIISVATTVKALVEQVWEFWTSPDHIVHWNHASDDWRTTKAKNDLKAGGKFSARMETKDGSSGFDFEGIYDEVLPQERIEYTLTDGRKVTVDFKPQEGSTGIIENFEADNEYTPKMQKEGWQAILNNFKKYVELHKNQSENNEMKKI